MIIQAPNKMLNTKCRPVSNKENISDVLDLMLSDVIKSNGCGIAAPQVGIDKCIIWVCCSAFTGFVINPAIVNWSGKLKKSREGCLSLKGHKLVNVMRDRKITIEGIDSDGERLSIEAKNQSAFVFQHELDHLNGVTLLDHLKGDSK
tara:strand:- start:18675 stop:19115 length:441 start_codon:yes stop_codon:yes gene_type:complete